MPATPKLFSSIFTFGRILTFTYVLTIIAGFAAYLYVPIIQFFKYGFSLYQNGADEAIYLNNFFASKTAGPGRLAEYLVMFIHDLGLSGGTINLGMDLVSLTVISFATYKTLGCAFPNADRNSLLFSLVLILFMPIALSPQNPAVFETIKAVRSEELLRRYVVWSDLLNPVYLRTPESQTSLTLLVLCIWLSIRQKLPILIFLALPFQYFFVALYVATVLSVYYIAHYLEDRFKRLNSVSAMLVSTFSTLIFSGLALHLLFVFRGDDVFATRLPVFGIGMLWMILSIIVCRFVFNRPGLSRSEQRFVSSLTLGTMVLYNTQIVSGGIVQPQHFEAELCLVPGVIFAVYCLRSVGARTIIQKSLFIGLYAISILFIGKYAIRDFAKLDYKIGDFDVLLKSSSIGDDLKTQPEMVAVNSQELSTLISGLYLNSGKPLISSLHYVFFEEESFHQDFVIFKEHLKRVDRSVALPMGDLIDELDKSYAGLSDNFLPLYVARRGLISRTFKVPQTLPQRNFKLYTVK